MTLVTYASASVLPRDKDTGACAGLLDFCASGIHLECCEGLTCILPGVVSVQLFVIESKKMLTSPAVHPYSLVSDPEEND